MVFKFVRVDCSQPVKIDLPIGKYTIGRGEFLLNDAADKKVSRTHAELQVTSDTVTATSLHQNPCYYIKKGTKNKEILPRSITVTLCHGDRFGLLPETYWFELIHCNIEDVQQNHSFSVENITKESLGNDSVNRTNVKKEPNEVLNDTISNVDVQDSDLLQQKGNASLGLHWLAKDCDNAAVATGNNCVTTPGKRPHNPEESSTNDGTKKIKTEPSNSDTNQGSVQAFAGLLSCIISGLTDGHSDNSRPTNNPEPANEGGPSEQATSQVNPPPSVRLRERCMYGAACYRVKPNHKEVFSHPQDPDWAAEERGECQFGAGCRRRNPEHWRLYRHPPSTQPPPAASTSGTSVVRRRGNVYYINAHSVTFQDDRLRAQDSDGNTIYEDGGDDDHDGALASDSDSDSDAGPPPASPQRGLRGGGKRVRRAVHRGGLPEWSEPEEREPDPYATDDSDEWHPPGCNPHTQT